MYGIQSLSTVCLHASSVHNVQEQNMANIL